MDIRVNDGRNWSYIKKEILSFVKDFVGQHDIKTFVDDENWVREGESDTRYYKYDHWYEKGRDKYDSFIFKNGNKVGKNIGINKKVDQIFTTRNADGTYFVGA